MRAIAAPRSHLLGCAELSGAAIVRALSEQHVDRLLAGIEGAFGRQERVDEHHPFVRLVPHDGNLLRPVLALRPIRMA
jgi:hypothetical protein